MFSLCVSVHRGGGVLSHNALGVLDPTPAPPPRPRPPPPQQSFGQKVLDKKVLDKKLDKHFGNFWRWGARAVTPLAVTQEDCLVLFCGDTVKRYQLISFVAFMEKLNGSFGYTGLTRFIRTRIIRSFI